MAHRRRRKTRQQAATQERSPQRYRPTVLPAAIQTVAIDFGTLELQNKRKAAVGENGDPNLSATAIGMLLACGALADDPELARERYEAAWRYRRLRCAVYGPPWPSNVLGHDANDERLLRAHRQFAALVGFWAPAGEWCPAQEPEARFQQGRLTRDQVVIIENVCVFDGKPMWFDAQRLGLKLLPEDIAERELLLAGLDAIRGEKTATVQNAA